ncbi:unnamed protein product, partial [Mesorhabditis belari]|uniref:Uncharacterized protein n=1 Tax=Mesorhabditis belari TaxID=2138241 RepID=A0AAF3FHW4_9BILA
MALESLRNGTSTRFNRQEAFDLVSIVKKLRDQRLHAIQSDLQFFVFVFRCTQGFGREEAPARIDTRRSSSTITTPSPRRKRKSRRSWQIENNAFDELADN